MCVKSAWLITFELTSADSAVSSRMRAHWKCRRRRMTARVTAASLWLQGCFNLRNEENKLQTFKEVSILMRHLKTKSKQEEAKWRHLFWRHVWTWSGRKHKLLKKLNDVNQNRRVSHKSIYASIHRNRYERFSGAAFTPLSNLQQRQKIFKPRSGAD